jgi:hypothetical protein
MRSDLMVADLMVAEAKHDIDCRVVSLRYIARSD